MDYQEKQKGALWKLGEKVKHNSCLLFHYIISGDGKQSGPVTALCPRWAASPKGRKPVQIWRKAQSDTENLAPTPGLSVEQIQFPSNYSTSWKEPTAPGFSSWSVYYSFSQHDFGWEQTPQSSCVPGLNENSGCSPLLGTIRMFQYSSIKKANSANKLI